MSGLHYVDTLYWDGKNETSELVPSGIYFYMIKAGELIAVRKMVMVR